MGSSTSILYPLTGIKFVFCSSLFLCMLGWFSVVRNFHQIHPASTMDSCLHHQTPQQSSSLQPLSLPPPPDRMSSEEAISSQQVKQPPPSQPSSQRRLRVLLGIFTFDRQKQMPYRRQYRKLFDIFPQFHDTRVCSLYDFEHTLHAQERYECQLIYTFVVGGLKASEAPTERLEGPVLLPHAPSLRSKDLRQHNDTVYLNIRENMNEGKSQTWFRYATQILQKYDLDYAGKIDSDSLPYLDKFFSWAHVYLPPPPYNRGILAGVPIDKLWWQRNNNPNDNDLLQETNEDFFKEAFGKALHLYAAGQCYILSRDLCETVVLEAPQSLGYQEGPEDHDISAMAFHSPNPISFHFLTLQQQFWRHPVKVYPKKMKRWRTIWHQEHVRMKKVLALRQEHLLNGGSNVNIKELLLQDEDATPDQLAAPVQLELEEEEEGGEEEEEAEGGEDGKEEEEVTDEVESEETS